MVQIEAPTPLRLTEAAGQRLHAVLEADGSPNANLRIYVAGGGCSGFRYCFEVDHEVQEDDLRIESGGAGILVDSLSLPYLSGACLDYREDLEGARFVVDNPQAVTTCGCGESFSI